MSGGQLVAAGACRCEAGAGDAKDARNAVVADDGAAFSGVAGVPPTRRTLLIASAAALPVLLTACKGIQALGIPPAPPADVDALREAIEHEAALVASYTAVLAGRGVGGSASPARAVGPSASGSAERVWRHGFCDRPGIGRPNIDRARGSALRSSSAPGAAQVAADRAMLDSGRPLLRSAQRRLAGRPERWRSPYCGPA